MSPGPECDRGLEDVVKFVAAARSETLNPGQGSAEPLTLGRAEQRITELGRLRCGSRNRPRLGTAAREAEPRVPLGSGDAEC